MRTCEARVRSHGIDRPCGQRVGLRLWWDETGEQHMACRSHVAERQHRYPVADPPEPKWLDNCAACGGPIKDDGCGNCDFDWVTWRRQQEAAPDPIDVYKSWTDAGWTEAELREVHGA